MEVVETSWSLGTLIGLPVGALITLALLVLLGVILRSRSAARMNRAEYTVAAVIVAVVALVSAGLTAGFMWPYTAEHHQWQPAAGTVASIDKRIGGSSDSIEERFVVTFDGDGQQYACDDTRCATVRAGDDLSLTCKREWEYAATDGYGCRFVDWVAAD